MVKILSVSLVEYWLAHFSHISLFEMTTCQQKYSLHKFVSPCQLIMIKTSGTWKLSVNWQDLPDFVEDREVAAATLLLMQIWSGRNTSSAVVENDSQCQELYQELIQKYPSTAMY